MSVSKLRLIVVAGVIEKQGEIQLNSHQQMAWVSLAQLGNYQFCAADYPIITALQHYIASTNSEIS